MTLFVIVYILGLLTGLYVGNLKFRRMVNQGVINLWNTIVKQTNKRRQY